MVYKNILRLCEQKKISVAALERELGFGNATIRSWTSASPTVDKLQRVAKFFGVTIDSLLAAEACAESVTA